MAAQKTENKLALKRIPLTSTDADAGPKMMRTSAPARVTDARHNSASRTNIVFHWNIPFVK